MKKAFKIDVISLVIAIILMLITFLINNANVERILWGLVFIIGGRSKAIEGYQNTIKNKALNVEFLMILSALAAFIIGNYQEGGILIIIFALSGVLEEYTMNESSKALELLLKLMPETAIKIENDIEVITKIDDLNINDIVLIKVGQQVPADGIVIKGETLIDESMITGEYLLVSKVINDKILSGTINQKAAIYVKLTSMAKDSSMQKIVDFVAKAQTENSKTEIGIKRFEKYYVYIVLLLALLVATLPVVFKIWDFDTALYKSIVLLVVASPCALVASVSPAMLAVMSRASKEGVLIKGAVAIQKLAKINTIFLDKTGTITVGKPQIESVKLFFDKKSELLDIIYNIEKQSNHPLAASIVEYLSINANVSDLAIMTEELKGKGIVATINDTKYFIGKSALNDERILNQQAKGFTTVEIVVNDNLAGIITFTDIIRPNVKETISVLNKMKISTTMITGDNSFNAKSIASKVGITNVISNCYPEDKASKIVQAKKEGIVAMIGDGINDGPSLALADIGIAMSSGSDIAMETSDVILMNNNMVNIPNTIKLAKKAQAIYTQNIVFSITVIIFLIFMNVFGLIRLPLGVVFHEGSTILVILNSLRLLLQQKK